MGQKLRTPPRIGPLVLLLIALLVGLAHADDASVLPKGVWRVGADSKFFLPIDKRFGPDGEVEDVAVDFNRSLDSRVFPGLAPLDPLVPGLPTLGRSVVSFEWRLVFVDFTLLYGLTDRLTVGVGIPYRWIRNKVKARVDSSTANIIKNPAFGLPGQPPFIPKPPGVVCPDSPQCLTTEDVQALLGRGLDVNGDGTVDVAGFGFKRFETFETHALGDLEIGARYQYLKTTDWRLAFTGGVRFPTGRVDDPDNLTDMGVGAGAYTLLFRLNNDYILSNLWKPEPSGGEVPGDLVLNGTFRYDLILPDKETLRVPDNPNNPLTVNKEEVSRDVGDRFEFEVSARYVLFPGWTLSGLYLYAFELEDDISGTRGFAYQSLEEESDRTEHQFIAGLSYSAVAAYRAGRFPLPMRASLSYRNRFAGSNNYFKSQYIGLALQVFF